MGSMPIEHAGPRRVNGRSARADLRRLNIGTVTMRKIKVTDRLFGSIDCPSVPGSRGVDDVFPLGDGRVGLVGDGRDGQRSQERSGRCTGLGQDLLARADRARVSRIHLDVTIGGIDTTAGRAPVCGREPKSRWCMWPRNTGNSPLWSLDIRDPQVPFSDMVCSGAAMPRPGDALVCRATIVVEVGDHWEEIEAVAWNSDGTRIVGKDAIRYVGVDGPT